MGEASGDIEHHDVIIVGAGISGIGAAYHLQTRCPGRSFMILEARPRLGGTWDLFRYPGIRSDSDMFTLGFSFKPWTAKRSIAGGQTILEYLRETASEHGVARKIRFRHRVTRAAWSSATARWTVEARVGEGADARVARFTCGFLFMCSGYYDYDEGYTPDFTDRERFAGRVVHPQRWTDDIDYAGKRVIVIGSGATAVTLVPALAERAERVIMLQRSPSYIVSRPAVDKLAQRLRARLPRRLAHRAIRAKNIGLSTLFFQFFRRRPEQGRALIKKGVRMQLPADFDVDTHFSPSYAPWDQRVCLASDGDLFKAIRAGRVELVTDHVERFTETGILLRSGRALAAELIITATGLNLKFLAGLELTVDGARVRPADSMTYKAMMFSEIPNLALSFGYTNASWTLKAELTAIYVCRLLNHMRRRGYAYCVPKRDPAMPERSFADLSSGYFARARAQLPKQGDRVPWRVYQNYLLDLVALRLSRVDDGVMEFRRAG